MLDAGKLAKGYSLQLRGLAHNNQYAAMNGGNRKDGTNFNLLNENKMTIRFMGILDTNAALKAVESDGYALQYVPAESITEAVALKAVESDGYALRYVPAKLRTEAVALKAVETDGDALRYVINKDLFLKIAGILQIEIEV